MDVTISANRKPSVREEDSYHGCLVWMKERSLYVVDFAYVNHEHLS